MQVPLFRQIADTAFKDRQSLIPSALTSQNLAHSVAHRRNPRSQFGCMGGVFQGFVKMVGLMFIDQHREIVQSNHIVWLRGQKFAVKAPENLRIFSRGTRCMVFGRTRKDGIFKYGTSAVTFIEPLLDPDPGRFILRFWWSRPKCDCKP